MSLDPRYRHSVTLSFDAHIRLRRDEVVEFVTSALKTEIGGQHPSSPLCDVDRKSIKLTRLYVKPLSEGSK